MLFFADVSIFAQTHLDPQEPLKWHKNFFEYSCLLVTIRDFEGSEQVFGVPGSKIRAKKNFKLIWEIPQKYWEKPLTN